MQQHTRAPLRRFMPEVLVGIPVEVLTVGHRTRQRSRVTKVHNLWPRVWPSVNADVFIYCRLVLIGSYHWSSFAVQG
jgi:hypothetical protein